MYAFRADTEGSAAYRDWLEEAGNSPESLGISELILSGFMRIVTHPRIFAEPTPLATARAQAESLIRAPAAVRLRPGPSHWEIFSELCAESGAKGNHIADAYHAALAIESRATFFTTDGDYARFKNLRYAHPLR